MSSGQRPRWRIFFPRMKPRGRYRARRARIVVYSADWKPIWPPTPHADGCTIRVDKGGFRFTGRIVNEVE